MSGHVFLLSDTPAADGYKGAGKGFLITLDGIPQHLIYTHDAADDEVLSPDMRGLATIGIDINELNGALQWGYISSWEFVVAHLLKGEKS